jgi:acetyl esterase/lipase
MKNFFIVYTWRYVLMSIIGKGQEKESAMGTETTRSHLVSHQPDAVPGWLTADRIKRGALLYWATLFTLSAAIIHIIGGVAEQHGSELLVVLLISFAIIQAAIAIAVVVFPGRSLLMAAVVVEGAALLLWITVHTAGFPIGATLWRPETLGATDLYLPAMEAVSAFFFLCLFGRTWIMAPRPWRIILAVLPYLLLVGVLIWAAVNFNTAELLVVTFILDAEFPSSLLDVFLPAFGLVAIFLLLRAIFPSLRARTPGAWRAALTLLPALLVVSLLSWEGGFTSANGLWFPVPETIRASAGQMTTLEYCSPGGNPLAMDLSEPSAQAPRPAPVVFFIHGGEGLQGNRQLESADDVYLAQLRADLLSRGFAVGSIDYGLAPLYKIRDELEQAKCAVRFLRAHANVLGIDPKRIGAYGFSEGGYLAAMLGTAGPKAGFDVGQYLNQSSRVEAVVEISGFTDLTNFSGSPSWVSAIGQGLSGSHGSLARTRASSPVYNVAPGDPPFLIIHGANDWFIAPHHAQELAQRLRAAGVPVTLVLVQHDQHGLNAPTPGQVEQPSPAALVQMMANFFVRTLAA